MAQYEVNNVSVNTLINWIKTGVIAIPEIQRPFVWNSTKVRDLIDSLYQGYPIGYIITWQNPNVKLKDGTLSEGKKILIDGQQRIMALTAALVGQKVLDQNYKKTEIKISFNPIDEKFEVFNTAIAKDTKWIDNIADMFETNFDSYTFVGKYAETNGVVASTINNVLLKLRAIQNANLGVIELASQLDIETVTKIFIRINSKGVVLSQADFAMSKISSSAEYHGDLIRKTIDYFCRLLKRPMDIEVIETNDPDFVSSDIFSSIKWITNNTDEIYQPDYTDVLRVAFTSQFMRGRLQDLVSLLSGRNFETREYLASIAEQSFSKLFEGVKKFINQTNMERYLMIVKSIGMIDKSLVRSVNVLNFGYILYLRLKDKNYESTMIEHVVRRWLVLTILIGRYSGSPESTFDYDIKKFDSMDPLEYLTNIEEGELSPAYWNNVIINRMNTSVSSSTMFNLFLMAQVKNGDVGFLGTDITVKAMIENRGDVHHLFPKNYLRKNGVTERGAYNQIANYIKLQSEINIKISDASPAQYMNAIVGQIKNDDHQITGIRSIDELQRNLEENCIPLDFMNYTIDDYNHFLEERRKLMAEKIKTYYYSL